MSYEFITTRNRVGEHADGTYLQTYQDIPQEFLDDLNERRKASAQRRHGEFERVASIPAIFVTQWLQEGFNIYRETNKAIVKRLKEQGLDGFLTTEKSMV